jgi:tyrosyl-tRNA synthetase
MNFKKKLAFELTKYLHAEKEAQEAQEQFVQTFQKKDLSKVHIEETPIAVVPNANNVNIVDLVSLGDLRLASSRSEAKRQIIGGAVEINGKKILDTNAIIKLNPGDIIKVGKVRFKKFIK